MRFFGRWAMARAAERPNNWALPIAFAECDDGPDEDDGDEQGHVEIVVDHGCILHGWAVEVACACLALSVWRGRARLASVNSEIQKVSAVVMLTSYLRSVCVVMMAGAFAGCGLLVDPDQIVVARADGEAITRAALREALRVMPDDERPNITNRGDLERYLRDYVDKQLRDSLRLEMSEEELGVPEAAAAERFFAEHPDQRMLMTMTDPTPLGISETELESLKRDVEYQIGRVHDAMLREAALQKFAGDSVQEGLITVSEEELRREYEVQKNNLQSLEFIEFVGLRFPAANSSAISAASEIRRQIDAGASFDAIVDQINQRNPEFVFASRFENNPSSASFQTFWSTASGAEVGQIIGPVFIPAYSLVNSEGKSVEMPDAYLVLRVEEHEPMKPLAFEDALPYLAQIISVRKAAELLREQHGVEFYYEDLWDPGAGGNQDLQL